MESLLKMASEKSFRGGIEKFRFCLEGDLTLDDTMIRYNISLLNIFGLHLLQILLHLLGLVL